MWKLWKLQNKHKRLEKWELAESIKNFSSSDFELNEKNNDLNGTTFDLKYLGSISINDEKSEKTTSEAIKSVLSLTKTMKGKKNPHVKVIVSPHGIEVVNSDTYEAILKVSIYKISYCSADGLHPNVFAFVGSSETNNEIINDENLQCHVFQCSKRKIAQEITLAVAKCFQTAYEVWRTEISKNISVKNIDIQLLNNKLINKNKNNKIECGNEFENPALQIDLVNVANDSHEKLTEDSNDEDNNDEIRDLLIDLSDAFDKNSKQYLQTAWVSFEDDNNQINDFNSTVMVY